MSNSSSATTTPQNTPQNTPMTRPVETAIETVVLPIHGMTCAACQTHVERSLRGAPGVRDATVNLLKRHARLDNILLTSFRHDVVLHCAQRLDAACGLIVAHTPVNVQQMLEPWKAHSRVRTIVWDFNVSDREIVGEAKNCGFKVYVYGAATRPEHERCREWTLDGVITDFPDRARRPSIQ